MTTLSDEIAEVRGWIEQDEGRRAEYVSKATGLIDKRFNLHLTLGQRMLLRREIDAAIRGQRGIRRYNDSCSPVDEGVVRFMQKYYPLGVSYALVLIRRLELSNGDKDNLIETNSRE